MFPGKPLVGPNLIIEINKGLGLGTMPDRNLQSLL